MRLREVISFSAERETAVLVPNCKLIKRGSNKARGQQV